MDDKIQSKILGFGETWFRGDHHGSGFPAGLNDLGSLFQLWWSCDSVISFLKPVFSAVLLRGSRSLSHGWWMSSTHKKAELLEMKPFLFNMSGDIFKLLDMILLKFTEACLKSTSYFYHPRAIFKHFKPGSVEMYNATNTHCHSHRLNDVSYPVEFHRAPVKMMGREGDPDFHCCPSFSLLSSVPTNLYILKGWNEVLSLRSAAHWPCNAQQEEHLGTS